VYLNKAQKYVLELLREYGALKKSQLEAMARYKVADYLSDLNGYLRQMYQGKEIEIRPCGEQDAYICLPGAEPDDGLIAAFDVVIALRERIEMHYRGTTPVKIVFAYDTKSRVQEAFVLPVPPGGEAAMAAYADAKLQDKFKTVFFLCYKKSQMKSVVSQCNHIFAVRENGEIRFFKGS